MPTQNQTGPKHATRTEPPLRPLAGLRMLRRRTAARSLRGKSRWHLGMAVLSSLLFWLGLYLLFVAAFADLERYQLVAGYMTELIFRMFFSVLFVMLVFSTGMILYAGLFESDESRSLLIQPIPVDFVFAYKFQEAMFFSCWGFVLLSTPLAAAYGVTVHAPAAFYWFSLPFLLAFCLLPGSLGALICLLVTLLVPRRKTEFLLASVLAVVAVALAIAYRAWRSFPADDITRSQVVLFLEQLEPGNLPLAPSYWISHGLMAASHPDGVSRALFYWMVLLSNSLLVYLVAGAAYRRFYRRAYDRVHSHNSMRMRSERTWLPAFVNRVFAFLPTPVRVLIVKDLRTFSRDPVQFLQLLVFVGLIAFYVAALGRMKFYTTDPYWRNMISFLNLTLMALFMTAYTSRFIFPQLSLEGQKLWILGLCPISRDTMLWSKFTFSAIGTIVLTGGLMLMGTLLVRPNPWLAALQLVTIPVLCCGVSGISVGLGARFVDLKQTDPSRIASSLPGTLNLVVSLSFVIAVIAAMALPCHLYSLGQSTDFPSLAAAAGLGRPDSTVGAAVVVLSPATLRGWILAGLIFNLSSGVVATLLPMRIGIRAFRGMEI